MERQPFTTAGILALQQWLYGLNDVELEAEALAIETNFNVWVLAHIELTQKQLASFNGMSKRVLNFLSSNSGLAVSNRLPINLLKEGGEQEPIDDKLFKPKSSLMIIAHSNGTYEVSGSFDILVQYLH
jgi:hypothetical protein